MTGVDILIKDKYVCMCVYVCVCVLSVVIKKINVERRLKSRTTIKNGFEPLEICANTLDIEMCC